MIGTNIRGIRHLWRVSDTSLRKILVRCNEHGYDICEVIKTEKDNPIGERMFIFNNYYNQNNYGYTSIVNSSKELKKQLKDVERPRIIEVEPIREHDNFSHYDAFFSEIVLLPETFDKDYEAFLKENAKMIKTLTDKIGFSTKDTTTKRLYIYTDGSKNFFQWAVNLYYRYSISMRTIQNILTWNTFYKQLAKNLSRGTITAYNTPESIVQLVDELTNLRNEKRINDAINSFNTAQKKLLKANELSDSDRKTLSKFAKLSDTKRLNFIKKASTIEDFKELMRQMRHVTSTHFDWNKESFMDFINNVEGISYETILDTDNVVLVKVKDYETIKQLGKTTNWCISKNKTYWNNYIENQHGKTTQYMIFDFSKFEDEKLSIVGFTTTHNKGITSAHNFVNDNLMGGDNSAVLNTLKSYLSRFDNSQNIYKIMQNCGIDVTLVANYDKPLYQWDREALMDYLYECVNAENVDIIKSEGDKLVLSIRDRHLRYFLGDAYIDNVSSDYWGEQHIIFIDFSMSKYDPNKLQFAIIADGGSDEDYSMAMYNETSMQIPNNFDGKLLEYGIPYDIIRRTDNEVKRMKDALLTMNVPIIKSCMEKDKKILENVIRNYIGDEQLYRLLRQTMLDYVSFDYIDMIYDNGYYLCKFMDNGYVAELFKGLLNNIKGNGRRIFPSNNCDKPTEEEIDLFFGERLTSRYLVSYIGSYLMMKKMLEKEEGDKVDYMRIYGKIISIIWNNGIRGTIMKEFLYMMLGRLPNDVPCDATHNFIRYCVMYGDEEMQKTAKAMAEMSSSLKHVYEEIMSRKNPKEHERVTVTVSNLNGVYTIDPEMYTIATENLQEMQVAPALADVFARPIRRRR